MKSGSQGKSTNSTIECILLDLFIYQFDKFISLMMIKNRLFVTLYFI